MQDSDRSELIRQLMATTTGDHTAAPSETSREVTVLVAAALLAASSDDLLGDARRLAAATQDRQFVAIAAAHLAGDHDQVHALACDHLIDHPSRPLLLWIVTHNGSGSPQQRSQP